MNIFYVLFPVANIWRVWEGMDQETVEVLASEFGEHEFRTKDEYDQKNRINLEAAQAAPQVEQKTE